MTVNQVFESDFDNLKLEISSDNIRKINVLRDHYVQTNKYPALYSNRVETEKSYSDAIRYVTAAEKSLSELKRKPDFNRITYLVAHPNIKFANDIDLSEDWVNFETKYIVPEVPNIIEDYLTQFGKLRDELEIALGSFSYLPENKKGEIAGKTLGLGFLLLSLHKIYRSSGGKRSVSFVEPKDATENSRTGHLMDFLDICFEGVPKEFVPSNRSLGDKIYKITAKSKNKNLS